MTRSRGAGHDGRPGRPAGSPQPERRLLVYGINPVLEALRADRAIRVITSGAVRGRVEDVVRLAAGRGVPVHHAEPETLQRLASGGVHQNVAAEVLAREETIETLVADAEPPALLLVLDGIEDPQNVGAILRTADAAGVHGVIRQTRRAAPLGGAAARASAGAVSHVRTAAVVNIARAIETLKEAGVWTVGLAGDVRTRYDEVDLSLPTALVLGAEGTGLRRLVRERCDVLASIPMSGHVGSLNVSVAAGVALFEAVRQRRARRPEAPSRGSGPKNGG